MTPIEPFLFSVALCLSLFGVVWAAFRSIRLQRRAHVAEASCRAAREGEAFVTRALQLFAHELQALTLTLRGHADQLASERHAHAPAMAGVAAQLGGLADELDHHLIPDGRDRVLACELIELADLVGDAIAAMQAAISPGRRHWRVAGSVPAMALWADRRALRLVLVRVLGEAVRSSGHDDWIEIGWEVGQEMLLIRVEDEGAGAALPGAMSVVVDSRGIGLRLSLARALIQAHGGTLEVEALARIGTRVSIALPLARVHGDPDRRIGDPDRRIGEADRLGGDADSVFCKPQGILPGI